MRLIPCLKSEIYLLQIFENTSKLQLMLEVELGIEKVSFVFIVCQL